MKRLLIALAVALLAPLAAPAQTIDFTLGSRECGPYVVSHPDCTVPVKTTDGARGMIWIDYTTTANAPNSYGHIEFLDGYERLDRATITNILPDGSLQFTGSDTSGVTYYGVVSYTFATYRYRCGPYGCAVYWRIRGGSMSLERVDY